MSITGGLFESGGSKRARTSIHDIDFPRYVSHASRADFVASLVSYYQGIGELLKINQIAALSLRWSISVRSVIFRAWRRLISSSSAILARIRFLESALAGEIGP